MKKKKIITLLTDFGGNDFFSGVLKGVILNINPNVEIIDITHNISSFNIHEGALKLAWSYKYFPRGTIHVAVVDPGVGGGRCPLMVKYQNHFFVVPDNGILSYVLKENNNFKAVEIKEKKYMLKNISCNFHARDIFCPAAAHLSKNAKLKNFGPEIKKIQKIKIYESGQYEDEIHGNVVYIDKFGNCITNIENNLIKNKKIRIKNFYIKKISSSYEIQNVKSRANLLAIPGSSGCLEIAIPKANAGSLLNIKIGEKIIVK